MKIITGMHRSGTSLVARLFYEIGADMGDPNSLYRPDKWNPDGYFEQPDFHSVNMPLINGPWWKFAYFKLPSNKTIMKRASKHEERIRLLGAKYKESVVKETRFCLTLPAWLKYGVNINKIMICLRDPIQVAMSIQKRNKTTIRHSLNLWHIHNVRLLEYAEGIPQWFVYYGNLLDDRCCIQEVDGALAFFGYRLSDDELEILRSKFIKRSMNHNPEKIFDYPPEIDTLWNELLNRHDAQFSNYLSRDEEN